MVVPTYHVNRPKDPLQDKHRTLEEVEEAPSLLIPTGLSCGLGFATESPL